MAIEVYVRQEDIDAGTHNHDSCPVALALNRKTGDRWSVLAEDAMPLRENGLYHSQRTDPERRIYASPQTAQWILDYDGNLPVKPFRARYR